MKKILIFAIAIVSLMLTSCGTQFGLVYGVHLTGDGDGNFTVTFPQGSYAMDGKATLALNVGDTVLFNDTTMKVSSKREVLRNGKTRELKAMKKVNDAMEENFNAFVGDGTYDLWIRGFVKEMGTGLIFEIDKHLTNRENLRAPKREDDCNPCFPYIK